MNLVVTELDNSETNYEQIPENMPPKINVIKHKQKNNVRFEEQNIGQNQNIKPFISGPKARMVRPTVPLPKPQISYDDMLNKMGMFVSNGKLHLVDGQQSIPLKHPKQNLNPVQNQTPNSSPNPEQNSYIYNKYFQNNGYEEQQQVQRPLTALEYRDLLIKDIIQKQKIKQMKSTKLIMPNSNINFANGPTSNLNKLFGFSKR